MKNCLSILLLLLISNLVFAQAPNITNFSPQSGPIGTIVTITGSGFNATPANNVVYFGATKANVSSATTNSLTVTVPNSATSQNLTVTNITSRLTGYSVKPFNLLFNGYVDFLPKDNFTTGLSPVSVDIFDVDGDGKSDLVEANAANSSYTFSILRNISTVSSVNFAPIVNFFLNRLKGLI